MDIFCEYMVSKKKQIKDYFIIAGLIFLTIFLIFLTTAFLSMYAFPVICFIVWGAYVLITRRNVEYEYIVTGSILDIDKIIAKRSRKRLVSVDFKEVESCEPYSAVSKSQKVIDATPNGLEEGVYEVEFSKKGEKMLLLFKPNNKVLLNLKKSSPSVVKVNITELEEN